MRCRRFLGLPTAALALSVVCATGWLPLTSPAAAAAPTVVSVVAGANHTCTLDAAGAVKCWGANGAGQLGTGGTLGAHVPAAVPGLSAGVAAISTGSAHTCALTTAGSAKCWGGNVEGQLGNGTRTGSASPVDVSGLSNGIAAISSGGLHTCALTTGGGVQCWGNNGRGQLGNGTNIGSTIPVAVSGLSSGVAAIAAGILHTCALTTAGGVKCWGENTDGALGNGTNTTSNVPVDVTGLTGSVAAITAGSATCALTSGGGVKCWGYGYFGQLGNGTNSSSNLPVDVLGLSSGIAAVTTRDKHACALSTSGGVKCWGEGANGRLGNGANTSSNVPIDVSGLSNGAVSIAAGVAHTCARTSAGGVRCWGENGSGQLGNGTNSGSATPVDVVVDTTAPTVSLTGVTDGGVYPLSAVPTPDCQASDQWGLAPGYPSSTYGPSGVGPKSATCWATDLAGNQTVATAHYTVAYGFAGFSAPRPGSRWPMGSSVVVKLALTGTAGHQLSDTIAAGFQANVRVGLFSTPDGAGASLAANTGCTYKATPNRYLCSLPIPTGLVVGATYYIGALEDVGTGNVLAPARTTGTMNPAAIIVKA